MVKIMDRLLLFIYTILVGVGLAALLSAAFGLVSFDDAGDFLYNLYYDSAIAYPIIGLALVALLISCRFFYVAVRRGRSQVPSIDQRTDFGDIRISLETVENLSLKAASRVRGVKDLKARVSVTDAGLEIVIRALVDGENSIPDMSEEVQRSVKGHLEDVTGIPVSKVSVFVANVTQTTTFKSRVE